MPIRDANLTDYAIDHYMHPLGLCSLCGNTGVIDTRGVRSPAGVECGRLNWCLCPNGQAWRKVAGGEPTTEQYDHCRGSRGGRS